jgi:hypothetical protein
VVDLCVSRKENSAQATILLHHGRTPIALMARSSVTAMLHKRASDRSLPIYWVESRARAPRCNGQNRSLYPVNNHYFPHSQYHIGKEQVN